MWTDANLVRGLAHSFFLPRRLSDARIVSPNVRVRACCSPSSTGVYVVFTL
jgi:hypothetical protein